jgi:hypothetical protein
LRSARVDDTEHAVRVAPVGLRRQLGSAIAAHVVGIGEVQVSVAADRDVVRRIECRSAKVGHEHRRLLRHQVE